MGDKVNIKDVAEDAGVSVGTVSNVINRPDAVAAGTARRVRDSIRRLGYVRSESARRLRTGTSRFMALLVLDMGNPFFADVARGAEQEIRAAGLGMMLCNSDQSPAEEAEFLGLLAEQRVAGVLVTPCDEDAGNLRAFAGHGIPYVVVDRTAEGLDACAVSVDDVLGGTLAVRHLVESGHRRIGFVGGPASLTQIRDRRQGALAALAEAGLGADALAEIGAERRDVAAGRDAAARLLGLWPRPTAVFCANDLLALGMLQGLFAAGVEVPGEVAIVGYDDIDFAAAATVPLTSVRQPAEAMGRLAARLLLAEAGVPEAGGTAEGVPQRGRGRHRHREELLKPELVVRRSTLGGR